MFTGIIESVGIVAELTPTSSGARLIVENLLADPLAIGESIAVDGVCLSVVDHNPKTWAADLSPTTLHTTTLGSLDRGSPVNLERALRLGQRLSGHWVTGHVDETGLILDCIEERDVRYLHVAVPERSRPLLVSKGSIALAGISLTIVALTPAGFQVTAIPHTLKATTLGRMGPGTRVNLEYDILGKYVRQLLNPWQPGGPDDSMAWEGMERI